MRDLGPHPEGGGTVQVFAGRYGPYVKFGKINATLPKTTPPETVTLAEAVALIEVKAKDGKPRTARAGRRGNRPRRPRRQRRRARKKPAKKAAAKKPEKKPAAKTPAKAKRTAAAAKPPSSA